MQKAYQIHRSLEREIAMIMLFTVQMALSSTNQRRPDLERQGCVRA